MSKVKMSNSDYISLSCELAHEVVRESFESRGVKYIDENLSYTDDAQDLFNETCDNYQSILSKYIEEIVTWKA